MANLPVPQHDPPQRVQSLSQEFYNRFGRYPSHICRAPGRVNLIGEHIDYALFGVLPAAIERDILIACARRPNDTSGTVYAQNVDPKYTNQSFSAHLKESGHWAVDINKAQLRWDSYLRAGYAGILDKFFTSPDVPPNSFDMLVTGSVPADSGLSSSAALGVASALTFLVMNDRLKEFTRGDVVRMTMENEKRIGVNSGGMDQAASAIPPSNSALYITFYPKLDAEPVALPPSAVLVIAHSLTMAPKAVSSKTHYNLRVVETLAGARVLARRLGLRVTISERITFREVLDRWLGQEPGKGVDLGSEKLKHGLEKLIPHVEGLRANLGTEEQDDEGVTMDEMIQLSGLSPEEFRDLYLSWIDVDATRFQLYKRAKHVLSEALRVLEFRELCVSSTDASEDLLQQLGKIFNASQWSCSNLFGCSCSSLDTLTSLANKAGAYGSRLTGAGWGGCTVSLVPAHHVDQFIDTLWKEYPPYKELSKEQLQEVVFATKPGSGACVYDMSKS